MTTTLYVKTASGNQKLDVGADSIDLSPYATTVALNNGLATKMPVRPQGIELQPQSTTTNHGGYIDFHYNQSTSDNTSRIIESASGTINVVATNGLLCNGTKVALTSDLPTKVSQLTNDKGYLTSHQSLDGCLKTSGGTLSGSLTFANNKGNLVGDDCYFGDSNIDGAVCIQGANGTTKLVFRKYGGAAWGTNTASEQAYLEWNGTTLNSTKTFTVGGATVALASAIPTKVSQLTNDSGYVKTRTVATSSSRSAAITAGTNYTVASHTTGRNLVEVYLDGVRYNDFKEVSSTAISFNDNIPATIEITVVTYA